MSGVVFALAGECLFVEFAYKTSCREGFAAGQHSVIGLFLGIAFIEEYAKYLAVKILVMRRREFDEPVDGMIYLMTSAMGFAAAENAMFLFPLLRENFLLGVELTTNRFLGANLLHALASGIVGFFLARAWFSPRRHHFVAIGIIIASVLHAVFNYFILLKEETPQGLLYLILLLGVMAIVVLLDFERLRQQPPH